MNVLGLKIDDHDTGAALVANGKVVAIAEERLNRVKHSKDMFPELSIEYCLQYLGVKASEIDLVVTDQLFLKDQNRVVEKFLKWKGAGRFTRAKVVAVGHHDAHAASAFFCSPFDEAAVLVYDGSGEERITRYGVPAAETDTFYRGVANRLIEIHRTSHAKIAGKFRYTFGIGKLYALLSKTYLNFGHFNEGKLMGLAPYGDDRLLKQFPPEMWFAEHGHEIVCNAKITFPKKEFSERFQKNAHNILPAIRSKLSKLLKHMHASVLGREETLFRDPNIFPKIVLPKPARDNEPLPDPYYASVAWLAQHVLEKVAVALGTKLKEAVPSENLCVAGGVGLNIDANNNFLTKVGFKHIFVQPGASDTGIALGCALYGYHVTLDQPRFWEMKSASLGRPYSEEEILSAIAPYKEELTVVRSPNVYKEVAAYIADGKIIGWFTGGAEHGPRALGNRSIVCDGRLPTMLATLNNQVKHRELWRPFAASVLAEHQSEWFELEEPSPFMLLAAQVCDDKKPKIPSLVHVDGTCRIQSVSRESNAAYYQLLTEFNQLTGTPVVLNTSFNLGGEPIVETPADALSTFLRTKMDYLVLENYIVSRKS